jgi:hypothetical protein
LKCAAHELDPRRALSAKHYLYNIEAHQNFRIIQQLQPCERPARDELLLGRVHRLAWSPEILARARFHLYEYKRVVISANNVHFATAPATEIAVKNFVAFTTQKSARQFFTANTEPEMVGRLRRRRKAGAEVIGQREERLHGVSDGLSETTPKEKFQIPSTKPNIRQSDGFALWRRSTKSQAPNLRDPRGELCLDLGAWIVELGAVALGAMHQLQRQKRLRHRLKRTAMDRARSVFVQLG